MAILAQLRPALAAVVFFTLLLGLGYPLAITGIAQAAMPDQANGSLVRRDGKVVGSRLIGQGFAGPQYLTPRPSAAGSDGYDAAASSGSNLGPLNDDLIKRVAEGAAAVRASTGQQTVPADAVTTSGSGLDPHISPAYAELQVDRIARARGMSPDAVRRIIARHTEGPDLGFLGQARVNVLETNLALDAAAPVRQPPTP